MLLFLLLSHKWYTITTPDKRCHLGLLYNDCNMYTILRTASFSGFHSPFGHDLWEDDGMGDFFSESTTEKRQGGRGQPACVSVCVHFPVVSNMDRAKRHVYANWYLQYIFGLHKLYECLFIVVMRKPHFPH